MKFYWFTLFFASVVWSTCTTTDEVLDAPLILIKEITAEDARALSEEVISKVTINQKEGLTLDLWAGDSLAADPIALDIDDQGRVYITQTNRNGHSEFDIRGHRDWEIGSIAMQTVEDRRKFLLRELSPDSSEVNDWLVDLNKDGSRDWRDIVIQKEQIFRLEDTDGDGYANTSQLYSEGYDDIVSDCMGGLEIIGDQVYAGVGPDMWMLQDQNDDGYADNQKSISHGYNVHIGFGGHGMSGAELGPDGRLYWSIGDVGFNGKGPDGKEWKYPNRGVIVRSELDGSGFEVFAMGLRNTHEFVFDKYANLISEDNDGDHAGESERLVYITEGSDTGWRINWQFGKYKDPRNNTYKVWMDERLHVPRWDGQAAYITPCIRNYVDGPTGMLYNPGHALSPRWKDHFFIVSFVGTPTRSGIHAFTLKENGASFAFDQGEEIINGILPTGIDWGPDGAMYAGDWILGWDTKDYGRIWKIDDEEGHDWEDRRLTAALIKTDFNQKEVPVLRGLLSHDDMRIRQKAQFALAKKGRVGLEAFVAASLPTQDQITRVHGIIGLSQMARQHDRSYADKIITHLSDQDAEIRAQAAKWLGDIRYKKAASQIVPLLQDDNDRVKFFAAEALGRMEYREATDGLIKMLIANDDQDAYLRHAGSLALARVADPDALKALSTHPSSALRLAVTVALRRAEDPGISAFLEDEDLLVVREAARGINDDWSIPDALPALGRILSSTTFSDDEVIIRRAINANLRVGSPEAMRAVLDYAMDDSNRRDLRIEALETIRVWTDPSVLDRVTGRYRGSVSRSPADYTDILEESLVLLDDKSSKIKRALTGVIATNQMTQATDRLIDLFQNSSSNLLRQSIVDALVQLQPEGLSDFMFTALQDKSKSVRSAALHGSMKSGIEDDKKLEIIKNVIFDRTIEERQTAMTALSQLPAELTRSTYQKLLDMWKGGSLEPAVRLDLSESITSVNDPSLLSALSAVKSSSDDDVLASYRDCLSGGDSNKGNQILWQHSGAQCILSLIHISEPTRPY